MLWFFFFLFFLFFLVLNFFFSGIGLVEWELLSSLYCFKVMFLWDFYSSVFAFIVILISMSIFFFTKYYMDSEKSIIGFMILLFFFVLSMIILIISPNLLMMILGWDGLGITSYLLVVYYMSVSSSNAGMLTFLVNRLGDIFFLFSIIFLSLFSDRDFWMEDIFKFFLSVLMLIAFITKSAQIPFSSWLPAAMAAPTPVSSLVHSSTLVTAGVFLSIRFFEVFRVFSILLLIMASFTLFMAGLMALYEWDLKKIIALSTLSQLGFMMISVSLGLVVLTFFHLVSHALFKASLFMSSGLFIHSADNSQEIRNSFNFLCVAPMISSSIFICLICLCGFPFSSGFFSKDFILDGSLFSFFFFFSFVLGVLFTVMYSMRFAKMILVLNLFSRFKIFYIYENIYFMMGAIWVLILFSLCGGFLFFEMMFFLKSLFFSLGWKIFYFFCLISLWYLFINFSFLKNFIFNKFFFSSMWFLNKMFTLFFKSFHLSKFSFMWLDGGYLEKIGPQGIFVDLVQTSLKIWRLSFIFFIFILGIFFFLLYV